MLIFRRSNCSPCRLLCKLHLYSFQILPLLERREFSHKKQVYKYTVNFIPELLQKLKRVLRYIQVYILYIYSIYIYSIYIFYIYTEESLYKCLYISIHRV